MKEAVTENIYRLPLVLEPQPEGGWTITCPILPELITEADTWDEVIPNVSNALAAVIEIYEYTKKPLPYVLNPISEKSLLLTETVIRLEAA